MIARGYEADAADAERRAALVREVLTGESTAPVAAENEIETAPARGRRRPQTRQGLRGFQAMPRKRKKVRGRGSGSPGRTAEAEAPAAPPSSDYPIVGIGASAGGLEAFSELLQELPEDPGLALVLIPHPAPQHESALPTLLGALLEKELPERGHVEALELEEGGTGGRHLVINARRLTDRDHRDALVVLAMEDAGNWRPH